MKATPWLLLYAVTSLFTSTALAQPPTIETLPLTIGERGDHHRVWQRVIVETDEDGNTIYRTNSAYTEIETGMNVRQPDGSYLEASAEIEITAEGAVARKTRHKVVFPASLLNGVITLTTPL